MSVRLAAVAMVLVGLGFALTIGPLPSAGGGAAEARAPTRLLVTADEWTLLLSRPKVRRGPALIELHNRGEDPHDLHLRRIGGERTDELDRLESGQRGRIAVRLRRGSRYRLWCSLPQHRARGMEAKLKVARKRR